MCHYTIIDEIEFAFGDEDRKIVIFSDKKGFISLYKKLQSKLAKGIPINLKNNNKYPKSLTIEISNLTDIRVYKEKIVLYISKGYLKSFIKSIYSLTKYGSFTILEVNSNLNKDKIIEVIFSYEKQSKNNKKEV